MSAEGMKKNILIAGGCGFLGMHLAKKLASEGNRVVVIDNLASGVHPGITNYEVAYCDVSSQKDIDSVICHRLGDLRLDEIYHLASIASPKRYQLARHETIKANVYGMFNLLKMNHRKFFFASSSEIYGIPQVSPQSEEYFGNTNSYGPRSCYDEAKRMAETILYRNTNARIARIHNTYGPGMRLDDGRVVTEFIRAYLDGTELPIFGNGTQTRSFCYVDDMISGIQVLMDSNRHEPTNIGNPVEITMLELAEIFQDVVNKKLEFQFHPLPKDDPTRRCPNIDKIKALGWEPKVNLKDGLKRTVEWFEKARSDKAK